MKILIAVVLLAIVAGGVWVTRSGNDEVTTVDSVQTDAGEGDVDTGAQPGVLPAEDENPVSEAATAADTVVETAVDSSESTETQAVVEQSDAASPFATLDEPQDIAEPQVMEPTSAETAESVSSVSEPASADQGALENSQSGNIVVPQSYPVTDAAKYFIPKEQRGPGNLGGPPPLNFPGGPSDPNGGGLENTFAPPTAPGN